MEFKRRSLLLGGASFLLSTKLVSAQLDAETSLLTASEGKQAIDIFNSGTDYYLRPDGSITMNSHSLGADTIRKADPFTWAWVGITLAEGVVAFIGGKLFEQIMGGDSTAREINASIREAVEELKNYISAELRQALTEERLKDLEFRMRAIMTNLSRYAKTARATRRNYKYLIEAADVESAYAVQVAEAYKLITLPTYANLLSLRAMSTKALYDLDRDKGPLKVFADDLENRSEEIDKLLKAHLVSLLPENRVSAVDVERRDLGFGGRVSLYIGYFLVDGTRVNAGGSDSRADAEARAIDYRATFLASTKAHREKVELQFVAPMQVIRTHWKTVITAMRR